MTDTFKRNCIFCGKDEFTKLFNFTYNFLEKVRNSNPREKYGWDENTNNWIVECKFCKCTYVNEIIKGKALDISENRDLDREIKKELSEFYNPSNLAINLHDLNYNESILKNILKNLKKKNNINVLDYGSGNSEFSLFKEKYKLNNLVSYDPLYPNNINEIFKSININSKAINNLENIKEEKFDIIICQSVIEHVTDPNKELSNMKNLLNDGGIIYINNPYMNIRKDLKKLKSAKQINKNDYISCYHIDHVNYIMPKLFVKLCKKNNLELVNFWQKFHGTSKESSLINLLKVNIFSLIHYFLNSFKIYYKKQHFFLKLK